MEVSLHLQKPSKSRTVQTTTFRLPLSVCPCILCHTLCTALIFKPLEGRLPIAQPSSFRSLSRNHSVAVVGLTSEEEGIMVRSIRGRDERSVYEVSFYLSASLSFVLMMILCWPAVLASTHCVILCEFTAFRLPQPLKCG